MAIRPFLAVTEAEMGGISDLTEKIAWMACHFSPGGRGLSNFPQDLPSGSLLILDDSSPISGHDIGAICGQLSRAVSEFHCKAVLLDFQRPKTAEAAALAARLSEELPVILPPAYAEGQTCPVFLPPAPLDMSLAEYLSPWKNRELWLELALDGEIITLTEKGADTTPLPYAAPLLPCHQEAKLHCHYHIRKTEAAVQFTLWRTPEDVDTLVAEAEELGVAGCVGLWQELRKASLPPADEG